MKLPWKPPFLTLSKKVRISKRRKKAIYEVSFERKNNLLANWELFNNLLLGSLTVQFSISILTLNLRPNVFSNTLSEYFRIFEVLRALKIIVYFQVNRKDKVVDIFGFCFVYTKL